MSRADIDNLMDWGGVLVVIYVGFLVLGLALLVIGLVGGALMVLLLETAAYLQGQSVDGGPWLLVPWTIVVACGLVGWRRYQRFRQQRRSRQAVPEPAPEPTPEPTPEPSVLLEALLVVEDAEKRYGEM